MNPSAIVASGGADIRMVAVLEDGVMNLGVKDQAVTRRVATYALNSKSSRGGEPFPSEDTGVFALPFESSPSSIHHSFPCFHNSMLSFSCDTPSFPIYLFIPIPSFSPPFHSSSTSVRRLYVFSPIVGVLNLLLQHG